MKKRRNTDCLSLKPLGSCKGEKFLTPSGILLDAEEFRTRLTKLTEEKFAGKKVTENLKDKFRIAVLNLIEEMTKEEEERQDRKTVESVKKFLASKKKTAKCWVFTMEMELNREMAKNLLALFQTKK